MKYAGFVLTFLFYGLIHPSLGQSVEIPESIYFAGMKLNLSQKLRVEIAEQVKTLTKNATYFSAKVDKADAHFPIIERAFESEGVPKEFKYLAIQESGLAPDVVSKSNAVGYWQFKAESAGEVGITINHHVDERMHIGASSLGAAKYMKKNFLLTSNWIYALIAYNTGFGGVKPYIQSKYVGAQEMDLDENTHWYAIKFLAHKIAYEDKVGYNKTLPLELIEYSNVQGKSLEEIAESAGKDVEQIRAQNKWLLKGNVPNDKAYTVLIPVSYLEKHAIAAKLGIDLNAQPKPAEDRNPEPIFSKSVQTGKSASASVEGEVPLLATYNGLKAIIARSGDNAATLAYAGGISPSKFLRYNEMENFQEVKPGGIYYLESKNRRALVLFHTVLKGENIWDIAQKYGVHVHHLQNRNRLDKGEALVEGRLLYLKYNRPSNEPVIIAEKPQNLTPIKAPINSPKPAEVAKIETVVKQPSIEIPQRTIKPDTVYKPETPPMEVKNQGTIASKSPIPTKTFEKPSISTDSGYVYHVVNQGQTLYALSRYYQTKVDSIKKWNQLGEDGIKIMQKLLVAKREPAKPPIKKVFQVNRPSNTSEIAKELNITEETLKRWNQKKDTTLIPGEILKLMDE